MQQIFKEGPFSYDVRRLVEQALAVEENQMWAYGAMSDLIGTEVCGSNPALQEALKRLSRDHGREFSNIRKVGYVRLDDAGIVMQAPTDRQSIGRRIKRAGQKAGNIQDWESLADRYKREADTHRSLIGLMRSILKPSSVKRVREEVDRQLGELDVDRTLSLFRSKRKEE